ncbi:hypothetical protein SCLCIDRAFT_34225 [Scleroderma citrinum Foug A]|uniref:XPG-I domain-containing protein n=1 Tax=Scleroderma citrinum Foug A TaxID=1036808 RepID=A0A0C2ZBU9_9AGAM|nr:hypothetical protein SCLCIDRAFT_34225 [Scleroderma citrinum Foug A]
MFSWPQAGTAGSPEIDIIFSRLAAISQMLLHPYFVFDEPDCPQLQWGKGTVFTSSPPLLLQCFQELLTAFSFNWHIAPGEADAELAYFQTYGLLDAVVMPYNDLLLFGAPSIICSAPQSDRYEDVEVYSSEAIEQRASLEWGDLLLIVLMSSSDINTGHRWCSVDIACQLAQYGFGWTLLQAAVMLQFVKFMDFVAKWCEDHELAHVIVEEHIEFPDLAVLGMHLLPLTSWSDGGHPPVPAVTSHQPNLVSLAAFCSQCLCWPVDTIQPRLMDIRAGTAMRVLLQLLGNVDGEVLRCGLRVVCYFDELVPTYKISKPGQSLAIVDPSPVVHMSAPGEDGGNSDEFYEMPSLMDEDVGSPPFDSVAVNLIALIPEARVIDLTDDEDAQCFETEVIDLTSD